MYKSCTEECISQELRVSGMGRIREGEDDGTLWAVVGGEWIEGRRVGEGLSEGGSADFASYMADLASFLCEQLW